jgi:hypothetical protein
MRRKKRERERTLLRKLRRLPALPPRLLVIVVQQRSKRNFLTRRVNMHDRSVTRRNNVLRVEDDQLSFELSDGLDGRNGGGEDETDVDVCVFDTAETDANVVTAHGGGDFVFHLVVDRLNADRGLYGVVKRRQLS